MRLTITAKAERQLVKLPKTSQIIIAKKIRTLPSQTHEPGQKLSGYKNLYRVRVGDYRMVYKRLKGEILVALISHRKEVYQMTRRLFK